MLYAVKLLNHYLCNKISPIIIMCATKDSISKYLDLTEYEQGLFSVDTVYPDFALEYYRMQAAIVKADYFYCINDIVENRRFPFIYIYDQRSVNNREPVDLVCINKQLWTLGEITLALIVYDDEIKILDTRMPIINDNKPSFLSTGVDSIKKIDSALKRRLFEGRILEESRADYASVSPYQKLLSHIEKSILDKNTQIGCDQILLKNLLVKFILIKYLEEQVDNDGDSVFDKGFFNGFVEEQGADCSFCKVLREGDVVKLLAYLSNKFNGGIFNLSDKDKEAVRSANLHVVADALDGSIDENGQISIWRCYDFNLLPIEFISRLYEQFVTSSDGNRQKSTGSFYTPPHLARLIIDELLPFDKDVDFDNFKILDPSCGSGIFLVLAFKRLITLWLLKNKKNKIEGIEDIEYIKKILSNCIYGVDINNDALSITATSLQIELTSHIKPKEIWGMLTFDNLIKQDNLVNEGFFKWYKHTSMRFDIIVGNPPFNISESEQKNNVDANIDDDLSLERYIDYKNKETPFPQNNPALIFFHKSIEKLLKTEVGELFMIMPASTFLYTTKSFKYKQTVFSLFNVKRIFDFTPLLQHLWGKTKVATVAVKVVAQKPCKNNYTEHIIVRNSLANEKGAIRFQIDKYDKFKVFLSQVFVNPHIWKINLLGGGVLKQFIAKWKSYNTIEEYFESKKIESNTGFQKDQKAINDSKLHINGGERVKNIKGLHLLDSKHFLFDDLEKNIINLIDVDTEVRVPKNGFKALSVLLRLNINAGLPIFYCDRELATAKGVLRISHFQKEILERFVSCFKENRELYIFLLKALSPKTYIQQGGAYTIDKQDIMQLPIQVDQFGKVIPLDFSSKFDRIVMNEITEVAESLNKIESSIFNLVSQEDLQAYADIFMEELNLVYSDKDYAFKCKRQVIHREKDYVWVTFEHTNKSLELELELDSSGEEEFDNIIYDYSQNEALIINKIITYYGHDNQISFIKPNKRKYWMRTIAYRDAENVKSDMFKKGY